jgi:SAM-dependent methyltransferase
MALQRCKAIPERNVTSIITVTHSWIVNSPVEAGSLLIGCYTSDDGVGKREFISLKAIASQLDELASGFYAYGSESEFSQIYLICLFMIEKKFPDWDNLYINQKVETMPWYSKILDEDLRRELESRHIKAGMFLDLGTGPATQAFQLANMGFRVVGSDISEAAIIAARKIMSENKNDKIKHIDFIVDDILNSKINDNEFDYILPWMFSCSSN